MQSREVLRRIQRGFSLVEMMVGIVVGLVGLLVIYQTMSVWDTHTRTTTAGGDAQVAGTLAMFNLERDIKLAGMGFGTAASPVMGCNVQASQSGTPFTFNMFPVQIQVGVGGAPDTITILTGSSAFFSSAQTFTSSTSITKRMVKRDGFLEGDVAIVAGNDTGLAGSADCRLIQITDNTNPDNLTLAHNGTTLVAASSPYPSYPSASAAQFNDPAGTGTTFTAGGTMYDLGPTPVLAQWSITNGVLNRTDRFQAGIAQGVAEGVVGMKAEYGVDTSGDNMIAANEWSTAVPADWTQVRAVKVALLVRASQFEKPSSSSAGPPTPVAPTWTHGDPNAAPTPFVMTNVDGGADSFNAANVDPNNWRYYRYRVYEKVIPLRNMIWGNQP